MRSFILLLAFALAIFPCLSEKVVRDLSSGVYEN